MSIAASPEPVLYPPATVCAFLSDPEPKQSNAINATLDVLTETIAALQKGLEAYLANTSADRPHAKESEAPRTQQEHCKFCRSVSHFEEECTEADEYILARNVSAMHLGGSPFPQEHRYLSRLKV